jgi:hypothetical protein
MEHSFAIPNKPLNSTIFEEQTGFNLFIREDKLFISGDLSKEKAQELLDAHDGTVPEPTVADKLARVGLSVADLKEALGL